MLQADFATSGDSARTVVPSSSDANATAHAESPKTGPPSATGMLPLRRRDRFMAEDLALEIMRGAAGCNRCFDTIPGLERVALGLPKPRWIGSRYWVTRPRVVIVLINPGDSSKLGDEWNRRERNLFEAFLNGGDYEELRDYFRLRREEELRGTTDARPVFSWYESTFGLAFEEIAQINMAWCAARGNKYGRMLARCFERHTAPLLQALEPDAVLLSGTSVHAFEPKIQSLLPGARIQKILHYAHREGRDREIGDGEEFRSWFDTL